MFNTGDKVFYTFDKCLGVITGEKKPFRTSFQWQVKFGERDYRYVRQDHLEPYKQDENPWDRLAMKRLGNETDLQKYLSSIRLSGKLTNVFYSMMTGTAQFYPHQFKPVLKFIESISGSLLIADEVGLGKTVEALYIWKELIARKEAKKLLIIAPAALRVKWHEDAEKFFGIGIEIVSLKELYDDINKSFQPSQVNLEKKWIISLQGIRYKHAADVPDDDKTTKAKFFALLEDDKYHDFFDLIIVDEAHYLRNSETASFKTLEFLRNISKNIVLLSATPIQTSSDNLFNLLQLLSPEEYTDKATFNEILNKNAALVNLSSSIRNIKEVTDSKIEEIVHQIISMNDGSRYDSLIEFYNSNKDKLREDVNIRSQMMNILSNYYFYNQIFTRTRKRDTKIKAAKREACWEHVVFNEIEKNIYKNVKEYLTNLGAGRKTVEIFTLITRLRQLTSSIPAAIKYWSEKDAIPESVWSNVSFIGEDGEYDEETEENNYSDIGNNIENLTFQLNVAEIVKNDSKYQILLNAINKIPKKEKIIIFSFYRYTVEYLCNRLNADGIKAIKLWGGKNSKNNKLEKEMVLKQFEDDPSIKVLVSTEIGSEGIDMQFAGYEINYDLPWNPMRLEQRIGRIDRIGQEREKIFIYNLSCKDTIEDTVMERLYDRINIFNDSIGDIEQIIGDKINQLAFDLFNSKLSEKQKEEKADATLLAIANEKQLADILEEKAGVLNSEFQDAIMMNITTSEKNKRYITKEELFNFIVNSLHNSFPQTEIRNITESSFTLRIDNDAYSEFEKYLNMNRIKNIINIHPNRDVLCNFDPDKEKEYRKKNKIHEFLDSSHPFIKWLAANENKNLSYTGCAGLHFHDCTSVPSGLYLFLIEEWMAEGYRKANELHYIFLNIKTGEFISEEKAENIFMENIFKSKKMPGAVFHNLDLAEKINDLKESIVNEMSKCYDAFIMNFEEQHKITNFQQKEYATILYQRLSNELEELISRYEFEGRSDSIIKGKKTRLENITNTYKNKMFQLDSKDSKIKDSMETIAIGLVFIGAYNE